MGNRFEGIFPPLIASFTETGDLYEAGVRNVIRYLMAEGVHGFFINGSYGSAFLMTAEERRRMAEIVHREVDGRLPVITHVGSPDTRGTVDLARHAEGLGSAAVAAVVPYYYSGADAYDDDQIVAHFAAIAAAVRIPTFIYNNPRTTGYELRPELLARLVAHGVAGMKDSSGSFTLLGEFHQAAVAENPGFAALSGTIGILLPAYHIGIRGCVAGTANAFPEIAVALYGALERRDWETSDDLQRQVIALRRIQAGSGFRPAGCYTFLRAKGIDCGTVRRPWREPNEGEARLMREAALRLGLLHRWAPGPGNQA